MAENRIVEEIELRLDTSKATAAVKQWESQMAKSADKAGDKFRKLGSDTEKVIGEKGKLLSMSQQVALQMQREMMAGDKLGLQIVELEAEYQALNAQIRNAIEIGAKVPGSWIKQAAAARQNADALKKQRAAADESNKTFERFRATGIASAAFALAVQGVYKGFESLGKIIIDMAPDLAKLNGEWSATDKVLASLKGTLEDKEFANLFFPAKILAFAHAAFDTSLAEFDARTTKMVAQNANRQKDQEAINFLITGEKEDRKDIYDLLGAEIDRVSALAAAWRKYRGDGGTTSSKAKPAKPDKPQETPMWKQQGFAAEPEYEAFKERSKLYQAAAADRVANERASAEEIAAIDDEITSRLKSAASEAMRIEQEKADGIRDIRKRSREEMRRIIDEDMAEQSRFAQSIISTTAQVVGMATESIADMFMSMIEGSEESAAESAINLLKGIGRFLFGKGVADAAAAAADMFNIYTGGPARAGPWLAAAGAEMGIGAAMMAGGAVLTRAFVPPESAGGGGGRGVSGGDASLQFYAGADAGIGAGRRGPETVNIYVEGVLTVGDAARTIQSALDEARQQGLI